MRSNDARGSMPFALIAVAILLVSVAAGATAAGYRHSENESERAAEGLDSIDGARLDAAVHVNSGLGEMVGWISSDPSLGSASDRATRFAEASEAWIGSQFPLSSHGARVVCTGHSVDLVAVPADLRCDGGGFTPAYLKAVGTMDLRIESGYGASDTEINVLSDGSYTLPLATERAAMFESMASHGGTTLSQMMSSQLTALAQYRALNGYGGVSAHGERGTWSILTRDDARNALSASMAALTAMCFRCGGMASSERMDLADALAAPDGTVSLDLSAVYAQALLSSADDLVLRWMDYLYGFDILQDLYEEMHPFKDSLRTLIGFLKGERAYSGVPYLRDAMSSFGYGEESYRFIGGGTAVLSVGGMIVGVECPSIDLFSQPWLTGFKKTYDKSSEENYVERLLTGAVKGAATVIAESRGLGTVSARTDPGDGIGFMECLRNLLRDSMQRCDEKVEGAIASSLSSAPCRDEFYACLKDEILDHAADFIDAPTFESGIRKALLLEMERLSRMPDGYSGPGIDELMASSEVAAAVAAYRADVYASLSVFDRLDGIAGSDGGLLKKVLVRLLTGAVRMLEPVDDRIAAMVEEMTAADGTNPCSGPVALPGADEFVLSGEDGGRTREALSADVDTGSVVFDVSLVRAVHSVGFDGNPDAAYTAILSVSMMGRVGYSVTGTGSMSGSMGALSCAVNGGFPMDSSIEIPVTTAWPLEGVVYEPSDTILSDLCGILLEVFEPVIEPLERMLEAMRRALAALGASVMEAVGFACNRLAEIYEALIEPVEKMNALITGYAEKAVAESVFGILASLDLGSQSITVDFFGCRLVLETSAITWADRTKDVLSAVITMPVAGFAVTAGIDVRIKGEWSPDNLIITGKGGISSEDWAVKATVDPLMKGGRYLFTLSGKIGKNRISLTAPKLEDYNELGLTLSDVPGIGQALSNIPVPALGVNIGLDAGFQLRCKDPTEQGVLINEYESNPPGKDRGAEWVELFNNTGAPVDLDGWHLDVKGRGKSQSMALKGEIGPGELLVVKPSFTLVNTASDRLILRDPSGTASDEIKMKGDSYNDGLTWQRESDGSSKWVQSEGTEGESNGSFIGSRIGLDELKDCAWSAVQRAFDRIGSITDLESLTAFMQYLVRYTIEEAIDRIAGLIIDASVFVKADLKDMTSSASAGIRIALRTDGELVKDCLRYIAGKVEEMVLGMNNPYSIDPLEMFAENIDLEVCVDARIGFPELLSGGADLPRMDLGMVVRANLSSLTRMLGADAGRPEIEFGVLARDCPAAVVPARLSPHDLMKHDLWLFKGSIVLTRSSCRPIGTLYRALAMGRGMAAMDYRIPTVLSSEELMEKAFHRASKIRKTGTNALDGKKKTALAKVTASGDIVVTALKGYVDAFPRLDKEDDFLPELIDIVIGIDRYKKALGAVNWCATKTEKLKNDILRSIRRTKDPEVIESLRRSFYGRLNSYVDRISDDLEFLQDAKNKFRKLPAVDPSLPTIVVAGFPNVGKSNLVTVLSTAEPEIAPYPFTTKGVIVGHIQDDWRKYQIIDTPGLLDREFDERNAIEKQAVLALRYLTDVMLFVVDPSETCGFTRGVQEKLLRTVGNGFEGVPIIEAESKSDVLKTGDGRISFSAQTGEGMDVLTARILEELRAVYRRKAAEAPIE